MRLMLVSILLLGVLPQAWAAVSVSGAVQEDPLEREELEIAKTLRCAVCQNQSVAESNSDLAKDMRGLIREQIRAGKSHEEIVKYFVDRYGDYVLMSPPKERAGLLVWVAPPLVFLVLFASGWLFLRRRLTPPPAAPELSEADRERVRAARQKLDN